MRRETAIVAAVSVAFMATARSASAQTPAPSAPPQTSWAPALAPYGGGYGNGYYSYGPTGYPFVAPVHYRPMERRDAGLLNAGIGLMIAGVGGISAGSVLFFGGGSSQADPCPPSALGGTSSCVQPRNDGTMQAIGVATLVGGVIALGFSIPLMVIGGKHVPAETDEPAPRASLRFTPSGVGFTASF